MALKKVRSSLLFSSVCFCMLPSSVSTYAIDWPLILPNALATVTVSMIPKIFSGAVNLLETGYDYVSNYCEVDKYKGFKGPNEIKNNLDDIVAGKSKVRVYGQEKAKKQMLEALSGVIARVDHIKRHENDVREIRGNIVYLIGKPGTGKTKMCLAIADAFLKHPGKTCIFCHSESITGESELGTQLFKTISTKDIGKKRAKNMFTGSDGLVAKDEESPLLKHLLKWCEAVVIIDEYDKMKQKSAKPGTVMHINGISMPVAGATGSAVDNSADEIFRSIASTGKYKFMNKEVDCSKILFLITANETKEEVFKSFGIGGTEGGGAQRIKIIEFDELKLDACRGIVSDFVTDVKKVLTDKEGPFKLKDVIFDKKSLDLMAKYMFEDKLMQGRSKHGLEDKVYMLFTRDMGKDTGKVVNVSFSFDEKSRECIFRKV